MLLLAEDDRAVRELLKIFLEHGGYSIFEATDGLQALDYFTRYSGEIRLLLTDVMMPRMGGKALAEALWILKPELKVIFMSGCADDPDLRRGVAECSWNFIQKPFSPQDLLDLIRFVLDENPPASDLSSSA